VLLNSLNEAARRALETMMKGYEYQSDFAKKYYGQGREEGLDEGRNEGRIEGRVEEAARAVLAVLRVRGIAVTEGVRERIQTEKDPARLERWLEKAAVATSGAEVIDDPGQAA
jgi:predicted transposase YdaD